MSRRCLLVLATSLVAGCPRPQPAPPARAAPDDVALRLRVANAEARRSGGEAELVELASRGSQRERVLALRGLGRIGGASALAALVAALGDADPEVVGAAAGAIGLAVSLDDGDPGATPALIAAVPRGGRRVVEALGRAGTVAAQPALVAALADPALAELAALGLGRHGRRKLALTAPSRRALVAATGSGDRAVRYAAVHALAREHEPVNDPALVDALVRRLGDPDPETRAQAMSALGRRKAVAMARAAGARLDVMLLDRDWRVASEAVRALAETDDGKDAIAVAVVRRFGELERGDATAAHVVIEAVRALAGVADRPIVAAALAPLTQRDAQASALPPLTRGWIECLAIAATVRAQPEPEFTRVAQCALPDHLRLPLVAELVSAGAGSLATRRAALTRLLDHAEARVRAAGLVAAAAMWKVGEPADHHEIARAVVAGLAATDPQVAAAAVDATAAIYDASDPSAASDASDASDASAAGEHVAPGGPIEAALITRATAEQDPELAAAILEVIGKRKLAAGAEACRSALAGGPVRARAAASCLQALGESAVPPPPVAPTPPPVDVAAVIGKQLRWRVATSRGEVVIRLRPDVAPWAVATIVALTRKGFYDGLAFHRVVPNFVVQGGDPTESGSGGPGFSIPAEPAMLGDGAGYVTGGVGIADAGRDSGGSQWFIMHSRAPHLDGRYTWFGAVESGQRFADALLVGDRIVRATIEAAP